MLPAASQGRVRTCSRVSSMAAFSRSASSWSARMLLHNTATTSRYTTVQGGGRAQQQQQQQQQLLLLLHRPKRSAQHCLHSKGSTNHAVGSHRPHLLSACS